MDQLSNGQDNVMLDFAISKARQTSWASAYILSNSILFIRPALINMIDNAAALIGRNIIVSTKIPAKLMKALKACESHDVKKNIEILSSVEIWNFKKNFFQKLQIIVFLPIFEEWISFLF